MGGACSTQKIFLLENLKVRDLLEEMTVDGRIILKWILGR